MNVVDESAEMFCSRHPRVETRVRCSKCETPICTRCMVQTPVGSRCRDCAQLRPLPQHSVGAGVLARSSAVGLLASVVAWYLASYVPFLGFFIGIGIGAAVGELMSRTAQRRVSLVLEAAAVGVVIGGMVLVGAVERAVGIPTPWTFGTGTAAQVSAFAVAPAVIASVVAVIKLR